MDTASGHDVSRDDLRSRLSAVQRGLHAPKGQYNSHGRYNYRSCEDILEAVKPLLAEHGLTLTISDEIVHFPTGHPTHGEQVTNSRGEVSTELVDGDRFYIKATATVSDDSGEIAVTAWAREAQNRKGMDDSQITGSASSYARKYALNGLFLIDDTKDADSNEATAARSGGGSQSATNQHPNQFRQEGNEPDKWGPGTGGGPVSDAEYVSGQGSGQTMAPGQRNFRKAEPGTGGPATDPQKRKLWAMSGASKETIDQWASKYGESNATLTKGTASVIIEEQQGS